MRRILFVIFLLLLNIPQASKASAYGQNSFQQNFPETTASEPGDRFTESEDEIFSTTYERELLSRRIFKKSLRPLSRKEIIGWSFKTAKTNTFL
jgi:hypothetical protein